MSRRWHKSSYSGASGACVEVAQLAPHLIGVRDSKLDESVVLTLTTDAWTTLLRAAR